MTSPSPPHEGQDCWICCIIGPKALWITFIPVPSQFVHFLTAPSFPPLPSHFEQITSLLRDNLEVFPRYKSSKETLSVCFKFLPFRGAWRGPLPPPNTFAPKKLEKRSSADIPINPSFV